MAISAMRIDERDTVAVVLEAVAKGDRVAFGPGERAVEAVEPVPVYHKIALTDIPKGQRVIKYGECIGVATADIRMGAHVHVHNVQSESLVRKEGTR